MKRSFAPTAAFLVRISEVAWTQMGHPSENLVEAARRQAELRAKGSEENYRRMKTAFKAEAEFDSFGLRQCLLDLREQAGGLLPPTKPTLRGKFGAFVIRQQARALWWLLSAVRAPERALQAVYDTLLSQDRRQRDFDTRLRELEERIRILEDRRRGV